MKGIPLRLAGTALLAGTLVLRAVRALESLESVRRFYPGGQGLVWTLVEMAVFFGPYLAALAAAAALWLRRDQAGRLAAASLCAAAFFAAGEGLTLFARAVNGSSGYVGAEPLCSAVVCVISGITVFCASRREGQRNNKERKL